MPTRKAEAEWEGNLAEGSGRLKVGSGAFEGPYSFKSRFEEGQAATNPEELLGAAHAGCFTMALTAALSRAGIKAKRIRQQNNLNYSREIVREGKKISGPLAWYMGQAVVEARDLVIYGLMRRPRHPKNVYS